MAYLSSCFPQILSWLMIQKNYFGTDGIRGRFGEMPIVPSYVEHVGWALGRALAEQHAKPLVVIGRDTRASGVELEAALTQGLIRAGADVLLAGVLPTPAVAFLTQRQGAHAGAVISASHNPAHDNGVKLFDASGIKIPDSLQARLVQLLSTPAVTGEVLGSVKALPDGESAYVDFCVACEPGLNLNGMKVVVDAAHGAASRTAEQTFRRLGAEVVVIGNQPDGQNINDGVGATHTEALQAAVVAHQADLGLALDGDADRLVLVDSMGGVLDGDVVLYLLAKDRLARGPLVGVAGTVMSNMGLELSLKRLGVAMVRTKVGDRYLAQALDENQWELGAESSGHILDFAKLKTGDGTLAAVGVLAALHRAGKSLNQMLEGLEMFPQSLINVSLSKATLAQKTWEHDAGFAQACAQVSADLEGQGRLLVRPSGTEPLVRVMVEARTPAQAQACAERVAQALRACEVAAV